MNKKIGKLRYRTIPFSCEQKNPEKNRSSFGPVYTRPESLKTISFSVILKQNIGVYTIVFISFSYRSPVYTDPPESPKTLFTSM